MNAPDSTCSNTIPMSGLLHDVQKASTLAAFVLSPRTTPPVTNIIIAAAWANRRAAMGRGQTDYGTTRRTSRYIVRRLLDQSSCRPRSPGIGLRESSTTKSAMLRSNVFPAVSSSGNVAPQGCGLCRPLAPSSKKRSNERSAPGKVSDVTTRDRRCGKGIRDACQSC
jgi:hypothetical protein